ncbi:MAG: hypothetical protein MUC85_06000 [Anaerolineales bacterium]|nr:hypothetical protein [Anaerolineales bacterium]
MGSFSLENGAEQLEPYFDEVRLEAYHDALEVTEADPLVDYIVSVLPAELIEENLPRLEEFKQWAQSQIDEHGAIHIPKSAGLFIATNR